MNSIRRDLGTLSTLILLTAGACMGPPHAPQGDVGNLQASLQLSPTAALNTASYSITGPNAFMRSGTVDVSHSNTISFTIGGIPAGSGYNATITATATDGVTTCNGAGMFSITAGMTSLVMVNVRCHEPPKT